MFTRVSCNPRLVFTAFITTAVLGLSACDASYEEFETPSTKYGKTDLPSKNGITGLDYVEVTKFRYAINQYGERIYIKHPKTGKMMPKVTEVKYSDAFTEPGALKAAGLFVPGLLQIGGQFVHDCGSCGGTGTSILNINKNASAAKSEAEIKAW